MISRIIKNVDIFLISLCIILLAMIGNFIIKYEQAWYNTLNLPESIPSSWIFFLAWSILYIGFACAVLILIRLYKNNRYYRLMMGLFILSAILNLLWMYLFFIHHSIAGALITSIVLEFILITTLLLTWSKARSVALLVLPFALWVLFGIYLNYYILLLN